jgi:hypothetical protein
LLTPGCSQTFSGATSTALTLRKRIIDVARLSGGGDVDLKAVYPRAGRPMASPLCKALQCPVVAGCHGLNAAIVAISHPSRKPQTTRLFAHGVAKPYALHVTCNFEVKRRQLHDSA